MSDASPYVLPIIVILVIWGVMQLLQRTKKQAQSAPSGQDQPAQKTLVECPACKTSVSAEAAKCPKCGHPFPMRPQNKQLIIGLCFVASDCGSSTKIRVICRGHHKIHWQEIRGG